MTALANERMAAVEKWGDHLFTLATPLKAWKNATCCLNLATGKVQPGTAAAGVMVIGKFLETIDAAAADKQVNVTFDRLIVVEWWGNSGTSAVAATDVGGLAYVEDDQTVSIAPGSSGAPIAGRIWAYDSAKGVAVERLSGIGGAGGSRATETALTAFSSNNINVANSPQSGSIYDVPPTGAASTITLPAAATEGTIAYFVADGTKNGHTVQYRDATGPVNLTTALTASKRHLVVCTFLNSIWNANAYVGP